MVFLWDIRSFKSIGSRKSFSAGITHNENSAIRSFSNRGVYHELHENWKWQGDQETGNQEFQNNLHKQKWRVPLTRRFNFIVFCDIIYKIYIPGIYFYFLGLPDDAYLNIEQDSDARAVSHCQAVTFTESTWRAQSRWSHAQSLSHSASNCVTVTVELWKLQQQPDLSDVAAPAQFSSRCSVNPFPKLIENVVLSAK